MFKGEFSRVIGRNGRVTLPIQFREEILDSEIIVGELPEGCLCINLEKYGTKLKIGECGRILIPQNFIEYAGLEDGMVFIGCGGYFEIWGEKRWENETRRIRTAVRKETIEEERREAKAITFSSQIYPIS